MYKVKNKQNDVRKFRDNKLGKDIYVNSKKYVLTTSPPKESEIWSVTTENKISIEKVIVKEKKNRFEKEKKKVYIEKKELDDQLNDKEVKTWQQ